MKERGGVRGGDLQNIPLWLGPRRITGSDLCFSIRSVLLVLEPVGGTAGGEGSSRGEEGFGVEPRAGPKSSVADSNFLCFS